MITNKDIIFKYHKFDSIIDSINALEYAFRNSDPEEILQKNIRINTKMTIYDISNASKEFKIPNEKSVIVIAVGKASGKMLNGLLKVLEHRIYKCILIIPKGQDIQYISESYRNEIQIIQSSHPIPDRSSIRASKVVINLLEKVDVSKTVIFLVSGGTSSLMVSPIEGLTLHDKQVINRLLILSGAKIKEINVVRKHLSKIKGGNILKYINKNVCVISLILSDVVGDDLETIGSGLTSTDTSTFADAKKILEKYSLLNLPVDSITKIRSVLQLGLASKIPETLKPHGLIERNVTNSILGNNAFFCRLLTEYFKNLGYEVTYVGSSCEDSMSEFISHSEKLIKRFLKKKSCILIGGEITNKILSNSIGRGGRNQEAICNLIKKLKDFPSKDYSIICIGTDGIDGNSQAAGGLITPKTMELMDKKNIDIDSYLDNHDSYTLLSKIHSNIVTGYTGTNFNDIYLFVRYL